MYTTLRRQLIWLSSAFLTANHHTSYIQAYTTNFALGSFRRHLSGPSIDVIIEWNNHLGTDTDANQLALPRTKLIASQLASANKPPSFRTLDCVGWFLEEPRRRCGLLFRIPSSPSTPNPQPDSRLRLVSLTQLLHPTSKTKPSLADRVQLGFLLSYSMFELHLSHWLHKSFTASNILFVVQDPKDKDPKE